MTEEKEINNFGCKYAISGASAFIFNEQGKLFLTRSPKWNNLWVVHGGKVEFGESLEEALKREIKEETNLSIRDIRYFITVELNRTEARPDLHMVVNEYIALTSDSEVKLNNEHSEFDWRTPEDWLKEKDLYPNVREAIEYYLNEFLPKQDCENLYKRALADYQNLLKQTAKEKMQFAAYANEQMLREILPVYDHLKLAMEHHTASATPCHACLASKALRAGLRDGRDGESADDWLKGVEYVVKQFKDVLEKSGIEEIKIEDKKFDHNLMEALNSEETDDQNLDGQVARQIKAGYKLNGKIIEPVKVVVYKLK
ncbi:MAG: nucleotide exchange factor GrpE [Parcubacteria group bacterium]|nr:nucleotide exchange factor GrpE [Parcubacteria group bacterium]